MKKILLRPYQASAVDAVQKALENGQKHMVVEMPAGCGKTVVLAKIVENLNRQKMGKILVITDRVLIKEHMERILFDDDDGIGAVVRENINIENVQKLARNSKTQIDEYFCWIFYDVNNIDSIYERFACKEKTIIVFSNTPQMRSYKNIKTSDVVFSYTYEDAVRDGILTPAMDINALEAAVEVYGKQLLEQITSVSQGRFQETDILDINDIIKKVVALYDKDYERFMQVYHLISQTVDTLPFIPTDKIVVEEILTCFNRPEFTVAFRDECNLGDFDIAIKNTISLINTGKSADGMTLKYNVSDVNDKITKGRMSEIVSGLNYLRKVFAEMKTRGYASGCKCGDPKCKVIFNNDFEFCCLMNDLRLVVLFFADKLAQSVGCDFNVFPEYMDIRECGATDCKLRECMEEAYLYHNARLSR